MMKPSIDATVLQATLLLDDVPEALQQQVQAFSVLEGQATPATLQQSLAHWQRSVEQAGQTLQTGHGLETQQAVEDGFYYALQALGLLGLRPSAALQRVLARLQAVSSPQQQVIKVFEDRLELWVTQGGKQERRGGWPLHSEEDERAAIQLAKELGCTLEPQGEAVSQLPLFQSLAESARPVASS